ncbi:DUF1028 domain-containing protein [Salinicoccus kekensis]|uniref:Uncharacterized Ntn-hydrolase superfamily protein n=1 Tax=Salinicoccus kekensis TaxID=714307 RepID=A0A285UG65_9STAP|nr:DUF1028 domain-containing protein [Salinicoccus kekensis]SOC40753.1 uncharacterized Ntn-hydrolase superfamily protein [Salinicoccus kekensis]
MVKFNTFSITARCARTGQLGVAVSTKLPAVGMLCPFVKAGTGAIATQSFVNPYIGIRGLEYLSEGMSAKETKEKIMSEEINLEHRQFAIVDKHGNTAAFSGDESDGYYNHFEGDGFVVAGNMLVNEETLTDMKSAFENHSDLDLAERLLQALEAGQAAGGDKRGKQSAALKVFDTEEYPLVDLRVDEHADPVAELSRVYDVAKEELFPFMPMMPTKENPGGRFNPAEYEAE